MVGLSYIQNSLLLMLATLLLHLEISSCKPFGNNNGKCIRNTWVCDSEDDCGDKSDESQTDGALCGKFNYFFPTMVCIFIRNLVCLLVYACTCVIACLCVCVCVCVWMCVSVCAYILSRKMLLLNEEDDKIFCQSSAQWCYALKIIFHQRPLSHMRQRNA